MLLLRVIRSPFSFLFLAGCSTLCVASTVAGLHVPFPRKCRWVKQISLMAPMHIAPLCRPPQAKHDQVDLFIAYAYAYLMSK